MCWNILDSLMVASQEGSCFFPSCSHLGFAETHSLGPDAQFTLICVHVNCHPVCYCVLCPLRGYMVQIDECAVASLQTVHVHALVCPSSAVVHLTRQSCFTSSQRLTTTSSGQEEAVAAAAGGQAEPLGFTTDTQSVSRRVDRVTFTVISNFDTTVYLLRSCNSFFSLKFFIQCIVILLFSRRK